MVSFPSIHWQARAPLGDNAVQSLLISALRGLAALQVAASHLRAEIYPGLRTLEEPTLAYLGLAFVTGFAHQAVVVFFLISGWLVGGSLMNRFGKPQALAHYAIDRFTRLWTVLLPTLLLTLGIGLLIGAAAPGPVNFDPANEYSAASFAGNLFGLQTQTVPDFGGNYPLWSLAHETWYYIQFPLLLLVIAGGGVLRRAAAAAALVLLLATMRDMISLYFAIWLLGAAFSRIRIDCGNVVRGVLLLLTLALFVYYRLRGNNDDLVPGSFVQDIICSIPFLLLLASLQQQVDARAPAYVRANRVAVFFSEFSFSLYVLHIPVIELMRYLGRQFLGRDRLDPAIATDYLWYFFVVGAIVAISYVFYLLFERHTIRIRNAMKHWLLSPRAKPVHAVLSPD
ncbi:acyltransferase family protein [Massilia yuzhufengensis]|uniref:Peptidoglycan/LPS O-acetylase OafA/YrhL, contains acyltransferase and SGNH-hydrolase domains n=1 Tax=Massilia yuzhufengensis TaxID=1164594 RepID=A0A1I1EF09_9BURK|nr:acyltransferase family protein [Massilia yuzhufengensis]SFB85617.1 Peptidoglycan/LPS O-acetylase OafA/YrhL, contains acyltransferase and SGNH-hydrolase domains [Massilia yuzhufengensis]